LGGELIIFRQPALDREEADERLDRLLHARPSTINHQPSTLPELNGGIRTQAETLPELYSAIQEAVRCSPCPL